MLENTLTRALTKYRIHIQVDNKFSAHEIAVISRQLDECENYLSAGNKVSGTWLTEKRSILSKVVECAHDIVHTEDKKDGSNPDLQEEHQDLNKLMTFFKELK